MVLCDCDGIDTFFKFLTLVSNAFDSVWPRINFPDIVKLLGLWCLCVVLLARAKTLLKPMPLQFQCTLQRTDEVQCA
jgi:hypothetical protein